MQKKVQESVTFCQNKVVGQSSTSCSSHISLQEELGCWDGWMEGWMDGWVGVVKAFAAVAVPSCIRQWPEQLLQAVNGLIEVENLD